VSKAAKGSPPSDIHLKKAWEKKIPVILWGDVSGTFGEKDQDDET
jgi:hypothetical protein